MLLIQFILVEMDFLPPIQEESDIFSDCAVSFESTERIVQFEIISWPYSGEI